MDPESGVDLSSLTADTQYLAAYAFGILLIARLLAAVAGAIVVVRAVRRERVAANR